MKKISIFILTGITVLLGFACKNNLTSNNPACVLSKLDSLIVINKVLKITDEFADANNKSDYDKLINCWAYNHPDFIAIENLDFIQPDGIYERVKKFYTSTDLDTTNLKWVRREIIPLSRTSAHIYGEYEISFKYKSSDDKKPYDEGKYFVNYSALFSEIDGVWKVLRFHESYKQI